MVKEIRKKHIPSFYFEEVSLNSDSINALNDVPLIIELKDGRFFIFRIDDYLPDDTIAVYDCKELMEIEISQNRPYDVEKRWEDMPEDEAFEYFSLDEINSMYKPKDENLPLEEVMILALNPWYKPVKGIVCNWHKDGVHSSQCNEDLHDALSTMYKTGLENIKSKKERNQFTIDFDKIRKFIIQNGGQIP